MNDEVKLKAGKLLDKLLTAVDTGLDKAPEVLNQLVEEYLLFYTIKEFPILSLGTLIFSVILLLYMCRHIKTIKEEGCEPSFMLPIGLIIIFSITFMDGLKAVAQIKFAPKAYLIQKFR